jgi:hypothetical protein
MDARAETTLSERRLRKLEDFLLQAVVTASYGGAWLIEVLMRRARRAFTVRANQPWPPRYVRSWWSSIPRISRRLF